MEQRNKSYTTLIAALLCIVLALSGCGNKEKVDTDNKQLQSVGLKRVIPQQLTENQSFYAKFSYKNEATLVAQTNGRIEILHIKIGQKVSKGSTVVSFPKDAAELQINQTQIQIQKLEADLKKMDVLYKAGGIAEQKLLDLKSEINLLKSGLKQGRKYMSVRAGINGTVADVYVKQNEFVSAGTPLAKIVAPGLLTADIFVPANLIQQLKTGDKVLYEYNQKEYHGSITRIPSAPNPQTNTYHVKAVFPIDKNLSVAGSTQRVNIPKTIAEQAIIIPPGLVMEEAGKQYVFTLNPADSTVKKKKIKTGFRDLYQCQVLSGLQSGDLLIYSGSHKVKDNEQVNPVINEEE